MREKRGKAQEGAISVFVMMAMLFFLFTIVGVYAISSKRAQTQTEAFGILENKYYESGEENEKYASKIMPETATIPIYTKEQFWTIGTGNKVEIEGKIYTFSNSAKYQLQNDIIINIATELDKPELVTQDIDENGYEVYYYYDENYYVLSSDPTADLTINGKNFKYKNLSKSLGYMADGIVLHYDGINNTGTGHSASATTWKDLSGNGNDGILKQGKFGWEENCYYFSTDSQEYFESQNNIELGTADRTVEFVVKLDNLKPQTLFGTGNFALNEMFDCYLAENGFMCHVYGNGAGEGIYKGLVANKIYSNTWRYSNGTMAYRTNDNKSNYVQFLNLNTGLNKFFVGKGLNWNRNDNPIRIYSIRIYNRLLSDAEIQQNYEVDKARFNIN